MPYTILSQGWCVGWGVASGGHPPPSGTGGAPGWSGAARPGGGNRRGDHPRHWRHRVAGWAITYIKLKWVEQTHIFCHFQREAQDSQCTSVWPISDNSRLTILLITSISSCYLAQKNPDYYRLKNIFYSVKFDYERKQRTNRHAIANRGQTNMQ